MALWISRLEFFHGDFGDRIFAEKFSQTANLVHTFGNSLVFDWFQQVIDGILGECLERIFVVSRGEDYQRIFLAVDFLENVEAVLVWHLDVEKDKVRVERADLRYGFASRAGLSYDGYQVGVRFEKSPHPHPGQRFVIDNQGFESHNSNINRFENLEKSLDKNDEEEDGKHETEIVLEPARNLESFALVRFGEIVVETPAPLAHAEEEIDKGT